jgi:hypothetical protein
MKTFMRSVLVLALVFPVAAQRIDTQRADRNLVRRVETMANHLTVIELTEPVVMAAAGSPSFKIERQGNKVLIQPIEEDAATNLFIWTASGRFSYELVPATSIATATFAIDQQPYSTEKTEPHAENERPDSAATPIRKIGDSGDANDVIKITGVTQNGEQLLVRYEAATTVVRPEVFELKSPRSNDSLRGLRYTQLNSRSAHAIRDNGQRRIYVMDCKPPMKLESGEHVSGLMTLVYKPKDSDPKVLRLVFQPKSAKSISVTVVL